MNAQGPGSVLLLFLIMLTACNPGLAAMPGGEPRPESEQARQVLIGFLTELHQGDYAQAALYYGGSYQTMLDHNPTLDPEHEPALLRNACQVNGAQCLQVRTVELDHVAPAGEHVFWVEFQTDDGALFSLGPCCAAPGTEQPAQSTFVMTVVPTGDGAFRVVNMPPYAP